MSILSRRGGAPRHTARAGRREDGMAFDGDPAADGRTAAEAAGPPVSGSRPVPPSIWDLRSEFYRAAPVAVKTRPGSGPWTTEPFPAVPDGEPGMEEMIAALDARACMNTARFYESVGLAGHGGFAGASVAGMPAEVHHEFRYEPQPPDILRRVLDGLRRIGPGTDAGPATDLTGQGIFAAMLRERMRHPGSPAGTRCGCCGYRAEGFDDSRRDADLSAHVIRELYGGYLGYEPDGWLESAFGEAFARIAAWEDEARWDLAATWTGDESGDVAA